MRVAARYFNASSRQMGTLALGGTAPVAVTLSSNEHGVGARFDDEGALFEDRNGAAGVADMLRVNDHPCDVTDLSASNGVLHLLALNNATSSPRRGGGGNGDTLEVWEASSTLGWAGAGSETGALVPDVWELLFALGFYTMRDAIAAEEVRRVMDALQGEAAHTLLAVEDDRGIASAQRKQPLTLHKPKSYEALSTATVRCACVADLYRQSCGCVFTAGCNAAGEWEVALVPWDLCASRKSRRAKGR